MKLRTYRLTLSGLGAVPKQLDSSRIRVEKTNFRPEHGQPGVEVFTYSEFVDDFIRQGGTRQEAIHLLEHETGFETEEGFYFVSHGLNRDGIRELFLEIIHAQLRGCNPATTPNLCELAKDPKNQRSLAEAVYDIVTREFISVGTAINALEEQLG